jgi:hypothetical protein
MHAGRMESTRAIASRNEGAHARTLPQDAAPPGRPVEVTVVDAVGIGAGGSGAAAGLLHAFTPKGKVHLGGPSS